MVINKSIQVENSNQELDNPPIDIWMKDYAKYAGPKIIHPTLEELKDAMMTDFPELYTSDLDLDHLLEALGIHVIVDYKEFKVAWFGTTNKANTESLLETFQQEKYSKVRHRLGIDYLWIINVLPHLGHMRNDIFEALIEFSEIAEKPECLIIDL